MRKMLKFREKCVQRSHRLHPAVHDRVQNQITLNARPSRVLIILVREGDAGPAEPFQAPHQAC